MSARLLRLAVVGLLGALSASVAVATASHASTRSGAGCPVAQLASATTLKGTAGASYIKAASGKSPGTGSTKTIELDRKLVNTSVTLSRQRSRLPGVLIFMGKGHGGTLSVDDTLSFSNGGPKGALKGTGAPKSVIALAVFSLGDCKAWFGLSYSGRAEYSGSPSFDPGPTVGGDAVSFPDETPLLTFKSIDPVPARHAPCALDLFPPPAEGCYRFTGGWANDYATLAHCGSTVAVGCAPDTASIGKALLRWNVKRSG